MQTLRHWIGGILLAASSASATAGLHQICYEGVPEQNSVGQFVSNGVFGCSTDGVGYCRMTPETNDPRQFIERTGPRTRPLSDFVQAAGTFKYYDFRYSIFSYTTRIEFFDANNVKIAERRCTINTKGVHLGIDGHASQGAVMTGFSTDVSGLATSGVWRHATTAPAAANFWEVKVPSDFVAVGGGAMGTNVPIGALITESNRAGDLEQRGWRARTSQASNAAQPHVTTAWVIGLRIHGMEAADLASQMTSVDASTDQAPPMPVPSVTATQPVIGGSAALGGGFSAARTSGQFATVSAPVVSNVLNCTQVGGVWRCRNAVGVTGWQAESKDHVVTAPGSITSFLYSLPNTLTVGGVVFQVQTGFVSATSGVTAHPSVDVAGLRGQYALTGIGATVNWRGADGPVITFTAGNLLWKLEPRADLGGASVASKDHVLSSPASITGHALGIRLVLPPPPLPCFGC